MDVVAMNNNVTIYNYKVLINCTFPYLLVPFCLFDNYLCFIYDFRNVIVIFQANSEHVSQFHLLFFY